MKLIKYGDFQKKETNLLAFLGFSPIFITIWPVVVPLVKLLLSFHVHNRVKNKSIVIIMTGVVRPYFVSILFYKIFW